MEIHEKSIADLHPYGRNPRKNDKAVDYVANSIREFGFKVPMVIKQDGEIVCGHTRYKAAQKLGLQTVPCVIADDLTEEQIKAFRLADNKVGELAEWDTAMIGAEMMEIKDLDMSLFSFDPGGLAIAGAKVTEEQKAQDWFNDESRMEINPDEQSEEYQQFVEKFETKKTTDDCYTPDLVYAAVVEWVEQEYGVKRENFVRPFYPGGDFEKYEYKPESVVVDNPPFSIITKITEYYCDKGIRFFLFCSGLTGISGAVSRKICTLIGAHASVTYANGAKVCTSFLTNMEPEDILMRTAPDLTKKVEKASDDSLPDKSMPKYTYPQEVITSAMLGYMSKHDTEFRVRKSDAHFIRELDSQKEEGQTIFGGGFLLSEKAAAEKAAAEKEAAEKAAAEKAAARVWQLSDRERKIIEELGDDEEKMEIENQSIMRGDRDVPSELRPDDRHTGGDPGTQGRSDGRVQEDRRQSDHLTHEQERSNELRTESGSATGERSEP